MPRVITVNNDTYTIFGIEDVFKIIQDKIGEDVLEEITTYIEDLENHISMLNKSLTYYAADVEGLCDCDNNLLNDYRLP